MSRSEGVPKMLMLTMAMALQTAQPPPAPAAAAAPPAAAAQKHCSYEDVPGSNFQRRVCRTEAEEQQARENASNRVSAGATITRGPRG